MKDGSAHATFTAAVRDIMKTFDRSPVQMLCDYTLTGALYLKRESLRRHNLEEALVRNLGDSDQSKAAVEAALSQVPDGCYFDEAMKAFTDDTLDAVGFWEIVKKIGIDFAPQLVDSEKLMMDGMLPKILCAVDSLEFPSKCFSDNEYLLRVFDEVGLEFGAAHILRTRSATPSGLAELMVDLTSPQSGENVLDPACGFGKMLLAVARQCPGAKLHGWDIDSTALAMSALNFRLKNIPVMLEQRDAYSPVKSNPPAFDVLVCEPNFGALRRDEKSTRHEVEFLASMLERMNMLSGRLAILVPGSFMVGSMTSVKSVWTKIIRKNLLDAIIKLPANVLYGVGIAPNLLILRKRRGEQKNVCFIDASNEKWHERKVALSILKPEAIKKIVAVYRDFTENGVVFDDDFAKVKELPTDSSDEIEDPFLPDGISNREDRQAKCHELFSEIDSLQAELQKLHTDIFAQYEN